MPICKIYHVPSLPVSADEEMLKKIEDIVLTGLEAEGEHAEVVITPAHALNFGEIYVELLCRNKPNRTLDKITALAEKLETELKTILATSGPFKVRIIKLDEDLLGGVN